MTTPEPADWRTLLGKNTPKLLEQVTAFQNAALAEGALSAKTKTLMMLLCDSLLSHHAGAASLAKRARALGASKAEITETLAMAFLMGGVPALVTGSNAFGD